MSLSVMVAVVGLLAAAVALVRSKVMSYSISSKDAATSTLLAGMVNWLFVTVT